METPSSDLVLSDSEISQFDAEGFLIVDFGLDKEFIDSIVAKLQPYYELSFLKNPISPTRLMDAWQLVDECRQLAVNTDIINALSQLYGRRAKPFQTLNFPFGTCQAPHSDTIHFNSIPPGYMAGVWVALEDIDESNGPLKYYPGSHKKAELLMQDLGLEPSATDYPGYEKSMLKLVKRENLQAKYGLIRKGQAIIWHANLIHGGEGHWNPNRSRHSQVTHYFFEDCKYYTPMLSSGDDIHYRNPQWIPDHFDSEIAAKAQQEFAERRRDEAALEADRGFKNLVYSVLLRIKQKMQR